MDYIEMVERLQNVYFKQIVLISCGAFYIAIGEDAITLHKEINLKLSCMKKKMCKVGVPKVSIKKYIKVLNILGYSYIILDYNKEKQTLSKKYEFKGEDKKIYSKSCNYCEKCENNKNMDKTEYEIALSKYLKEEYEEKVLW